MLKLTTSDLEYIKLKNISKEQIEYQINSFKNGFPFAKLIKAATPSNGIVVLDNIKLNEYIDYYESNSKYLDILKFVPASGAASRMFKHLFEFREKLEHSSYDVLIEETENKLAADFFDNLEKFAFFQDLQHLYQSKIGSSTTQNAKIILDSLLQTSGLNYAALPKALLKFHSYANKSRLAIEEHFVEAIQYAKSKGNIARIHFTVSPQHQNKFTEILDKLIPLYEKQYNIKFEIELSNQLPSTDTIAVDINNNVFRDNDGKLLFRPGGHGALIENLNTLDADIIFIKNIDNVVPDSKRQATIDYKKALAAYGLIIKKEITNLLLSLESIDKIDTSIQFIKNKLGRDISTYISTMDEAEKLKYIYNFLNRPLRICGMVKNVGEPGGGPFWVDKNGDISLQIVETAEIDLEQADQRSIVEKATHFNPVDLVCFTKDYRGQKFNLKDFVDKNSAFISEKSKDGKILKAMELPGLWNGAMAFWNTIFVEVPLKTFNPVKTVNDLLREMHR